MFTIGIVGRVYITVANRYAVNQLFRNSLTKQKQELFLLREFLSFRSTHRIVLNLTSKWVGLTHRRRNVMTSQGARKRTPMSHPHHS